MRFPGRRVRPVAYLMLFSFLARADVVTDGKTVVAKTASLTIDLGAKEKARPNYRITGGARGPKVRQYQGTPMKSK